MVDLLEISRADQDADRDGWEEVDLPDQVRNVIAVRPGPSPAVEVQAADDTGQTLHVPGDRRRLDRVVSNLLDNAEQHGGGAVRASVRAVAPTARAASSGSRWSTSTSPTTAARSGSRTGPAAAPGSSSSCRRCRRTGRQTGEGATERKSARRTGSHVDPASVGTDSTRPSASSRTRFAQQTSVTVHTS